MYNYIKIYYTQGHKTKAKNKLRSIEYSLKEIFPFLKINELKNSIEVHFYPDNFSYRQRIGTSFLMPMQITLKQISMEDCARGDKCIYGFVDSNLNTQIIDEIIKSRCQEIIYY